MSASPRHTLERLLDGVSSREWDRLAGLYAPDAVVSHPFALPRPTRLVGRAEIAAHFEAAARLPLRMRAENLVVHETGDPEVVVAEFDYVGEHAVTARPFAVSCVFVVRARAGEIVESRDYIDHAAFAAVLADPPAAR